MKKRTYWTVSVLLSFILFLIYAFFIHREDTPADGKKNGPNVNTTVKSSAGAFRFFDAQGKPERIQLPVNRIAALTGPGTLRLVNLLDASEKIVAVSDAVQESSYFYEKLKKLPIVGISKSGTPDYEAIISLKPDLILAAFWFDKEMEKLLEPEIEVVRFNIGSPATYTEDLRVLAEIMGKKQRAEDFISWYEKSVDDIKNKLATVAEEQYPRVFDFYGGDWGLSDGPPYGTYGKQNRWVPPLMEMAGAVNISRNLAGDWITVDPEFVVDQNPDVIIREVNTVASGKDAVGYDAVDTSRVKDIYDHLVTDSPLFVTKAVKSKRVHLIENTLVQTEWFLALQYMAKWFHPDLFPKLDPQKNHQEYLSRFHRINYALDRRGVFFYPR
jgi:iron complex transport system substrate-binding protein